MDDAKFFACRDAVLETLKAHGVEDMAEAAKVLASAISVMVVALVALVMLMLSGLGRYLPKGVIPWQN